MSDEGRARSSGTERQTETPTPNGFTERGGFYGVQTEDGFDAWTTFQLQANLFLQLDEVEYVKLTVIPASDENPYDATVPFTVFNSIRSFKDEIAKGRTTTFEGGTHELNEIRRFVGSQNAPTRTGVEQTGIHGNEFVTPRGVLGPNGWLDEPEYVYLDQGIGVERKWSLDSESCPDYDRAEVATILETLPETRDPERLLPVLGWFYAAGLRPLIHDWEGEFNLLNVTGGTGAGKTATLGLLWRLFGMDNDPLSAGEETKFTMTRNLGASNAIPIWVDEYKPSSHGSTVDTLHELLRTVTRGSTMQRGNADMTTNTYDLHAPVVISGEQRIQGPAERRRSVMTTFKKAPTKAGTKTARAYKRLTGESYVRDDGLVQPEECDPKAHVLAYYRLILGLDSDELEDEWDQCDLRVTEILKAAGVEEIGSSPKQGLQTILFGLHIYRRLAKHVGADIGNLPEERAVHYAAKEFTAEGQTSHVNPLIEIIAGATSEGELEYGEHYTIVHNGEERAEIRVNLSQSFDRLTKYVRDYNVSVELLDSAGDYRQRLQEMAEADSEYITTYGQPSPPIGRAVGIHAERAVETIDGFHNRDFPELEGEEESSQ
jgi:hypothetical protein